MRVASAKLLLLAFAVPAGADVLPRQVVQQRVSPVFEAYAQVQAAETEDTARRLEAALDSVLDDRSSVGDESLAVLVGFYLGEHSGGEIKCELVSRGPTALRPRKKEYPLVIQRITAGEHCVREP
jgi:hypothetical protein